ncbi:MAG: phosphoribosylaminoimidazolesuccinocarboxamide synthase [Cyclobacteriaceae bacterium]|nr:phosphoribosylaminoimidazolesuccinocarboxamide synthase [Cyclobacteriaceae bacterium]MCH8516412.1 phosphoribosylaminoimidazolesuccinocarboxamide synthase [Cyclobacteriaceae bacterium]
MEELFPTEGLRATQYQFPGQLSRYQGKVRDVYEFEDKLIMIATDRLSAFDVVLPHPVPYKGQVLNQLAAYFLRCTEDIISNWLIKEVDPNVSVGLKCQPLPIEVVVRGHLSGHAWRTYRSGKRVLCGQNLPEGLKEHDAFSHPIITPTTKATEGHDEDISREEIIEKNILEEPLLEKIESIALKLFKRGQEYANKQGLILVDTKYEFGLHNDKLILIDEIHTPDSSRYFLKDGFEERQKNGEKQQQLSKEFVREWLIANDFQGLEGQKIPDMSREKIEEISNRYIELYEKLSGQTFKKRDYHQIEKEIETNISNNLD